MSRRVMCRTVMSGCDGFFFAARPRTARLLATPGSASSAGDAIRALRGVRLRAIVSSKPHRSIRSKAQRGERRVLARSSALRADPGDQLGDLRDEPGAVVALELGPGRERARI